MNIEELNLELNNKNELLREVVHRIKNNLQLITSLVNLQISTVDDKKSRENLLKIQNRIKSIGLAQELTFKTQNYKQIDIVSYINAIQEYLISIYHNSDISFIYAENEPINVIFNDAVSIGLIVNEILTNSIIHAFKKSTNEDKIEINLSKSKNQFKLIIKDNGHGLPKDFNIENVETLGFQLVQSLSNQLNAKINFNKLKKGTEFELFYSINE